MSTIYTGNGTLPTPTVANQVRQAIASSTNATPIVITTSAAHGFNTGDTVLIEGHSTNTNANGLWVITVTSTTTFQLNGSSGNGVGGATGYAIDYEVQPAFTIPSDGDLIQASSVNPTFEGLANLSPFLYMRTGRWRLHNIYHKANYGGLNPGATYVTGTITSTSAAQLSPTFAIDGTYDLIAGGYTPVVANTDVLIADVTTSVEAIDPSVNGITVDKLVFSLGWSLSGSGFVNDQDSSQTVSVWGTHTAGNYPQRVGLHLLSGITSATNGAIALSLMGALGPTNTGDAITVNALAPVQLTIYHLRRN